MSAGDRTPGNRVDDVAHVTEVGDYCVLYDADERIASLWFHLPTVGLNRIPAEASAEKGAKWTVTEDAEGAVTVSPSIDAHFPFKDRDLRWHGFIRGGVFEEV